jgi:hypothetical protein
LTGDRVARFYLAMTVPRLSGFFAIVVYTQRRVPDTEKIYGYQKEVSQKSFEAEGREEA